MKKFLLFVVFSLFLLPFAVMGQCGSNALKATDADGNSYASLKVGPHCWTQYNLKTKAEGSFIYKSDMYPDTTANLGIYGRLYNWYTAMNVQPGQSPVVGEHGFVQGICPEGWHLPNEVEVTQLMTNTTPTLHDVQYWLVPGTNTTTYTMRPGGFFNAEKDYGENLCGNSFMWTAQSLDENNPLVVWSDCHCDHFIVDKAIATDGMSVRCVYKIYQGTVTTDSATNITDKSATLYGTVAFNGYDEEYERGFVYGTSSDNLDQWVVENQAASEATAPFNKEITGLSAATTYYYQAYVVNDFDTAWGEIKDFTTLQMQVSTDSANTITHYAATLHGNLIYLDYASVNAGFKYGTSESALTSISEVSTLSNLGQYSATLEGLAEGTTYFFKAFAANGTDTVYGNVKSFTTKDIAVAANAATNVQSAAATLNGELTILKGYEDAKGGFRYGQHKNYMVFFAEKEDAMTATGSYSVDLSNISPNTTYYFQAYAYNGIDTAWAADTLTFTTLTVPCLGAVRANERATELGIDSVLDNEGNSYITVQIGNQCWMAQNLRTTQYADGTTTIELGTTTSTETAYRYFPDGDTNNVATYGHLYNWKAVMGSSASSNNIPSGVQGICPDGWHVPSDAEWDTLTHYVNSVANYKCDGTDDYIAKALASKTGWKENGTNCAVGNNQSENNATGFSAVPAGYYNGKCRGFGTYAFFWSATQDVSSSFAYHCTLNYYNAVVDGYNIYKDNGFSVRCVRDEEEPPFTCGTSKVKDIDNYEYNTVQIGNQCWMKENLRTTTISEGAIYTPSEIGYDVHTYGLLYNWVAVMQGAPSSETAPSGVQGICPAGWHVPSNAEWTQLTNYVKSQQEYVCEGCTGQDDETTTFCITKALASTTGWSESPNACAIGNSPEDNNKTGFSAVPAGNVMASYHDGFSSDNKIWSATQYNSEEAYHLTLNNNSTETDLNSNDKYDVFNSVRCVRDDMSVTTNSATTVTKNGATLYGNVTSLGTYNQVNAGFKYGTSESTLTSIVSDGVSTTAPGMFSFGITGLTANTQYYYKAFAANGTDTVYGEVKNFKTLSINPCPNAATVTDVDNNVYNTVQIGNQCWMAENLRTTKYADGTTTIELGSSASTETAYRYNPNNSDTTVSTYGYLYNWKAVMGTSTSSEANPSGVQGICPTGWHVPSDAEWTQLTGYVSSQSAYQCNGSTSNIAKALASTSGWNSSTSTCAVGNNQSGNNATGFSAVPAGNYFVSYKYFGLDAYFWSATQKDSDFAYYRDLYCPNATVSRASYNKNYGFSVRCLRDAEVPAAMSVTSDSANTVTKNGATLYGNVTSLGTYNQVNAGFKYGTSDSTLTTIVAKENAMNATGLFSCDITGLTANTQYYYKAFAANGTDTVYGEVKNFTTLTDVVTDTIAFVPNGGQGAMDTMLVNRGDTVLNANTYTHGGNWHFDGWNTAADGSGTQYADQDAITTNGNLTLYAQWHTWCTGIPKTSVNEFGNNCIDSVKDIDNNKYNVVQIGNQCWLKENLRTFTNPKDTGHIYAPYGGNSYGRMYDWDALMQGADSTSAAPSGVQGICPAGWHVPSSAEFDTLINYLGGQSVYVCGDNNDNVAKTLASTTGWVSSNDTCTVGNNPSANNTTGFSAVPAGFYEERLYDKDYVAAFGSATLKFDSHYHHDTHEYWHLSHGDTYVNSYVTRKADNAGFSVRCVRDEEEPPFTCGTSKVKDIDDNEYNTIQIGNQCWMAQNLRTNVDGGVYPKKGDTELTADEQVTYGRLYTWDAMMSGSPSTNYPAGNTAADTIVQGICPEGWHVPSDAEWDTLTHYVFNSTSPDYKCGEGCGSWSAQSDVSCIAKALSSTTGWDSSSSDGCNAGNTGDKANATGFAAVPAGTCFTDNFFQFGGYAYFWSATQSDANNVRFRYLHGDDSYVFRSFDTKFAGYSVRCVRDN